MTKENAEIWLQEEHGESPAVWTQCAVVCFVAPPGTQTFGCLRLYWQPVTLCSVMPKPTYCILAGMDQDNSVQFVLPNRVVPLHSLVKESSLGKMPQQCGSAVQVQVWSLHQRLGLGSLWTWIERVMGLLLIFLWPPHPPPPPPPPLKMQDRSFVVTSLCRNDNYAPVEASFTKTY